MKRLLFLFYGIPFGVYRQRLKKNIITIIGKVRLEKYDEGAAKYYSTFNAREVAFLVERLSENIVK